VVVSIKLFLIPLFLWLVATRRYAALIRASVIAFVISAGAWVAVGIDELRQYEHTLRAFAATAQHRGYSVISLLTQQGIGQTAAYAIALIVAGVVLVAGLRTRPRVREMFARERVALSACIGASLVGSPVMESHYLSLLLIPLALARPRLGVAWVLPLVMWLAPIDHPAAWQRVLVLGVGGAILTLTLRRHTRQSPQTAPDDGHAASAYGRATRERRYAGSVL
jgi:hypothetical protein